LERFGDVHEIRTFSPPTAGGPCAVCCEISAGVKPAPLPRSALRRHDSDLIMQECIALPRLTPRGARLDFSLAARIIKLSEASTYASRRPSMVQTSQPWGDHDHPVRQNQAHCGWPVLRSGWALLRRFLRLSLLSSAGSPGPAHPPDPLAVAIRGTRRGIRPVMPPIRRSRGRYYTLFQHQDSAVHDCSQPGCDPFRRPSESLWPNALPLEPQSNPRPSIAGKLSHFKP